MSVNYLVVYLYNFIIKPEFREQDPRFTRLIKNLAVIDCHIWTCSRFFGCPGTLIASLVHPILGLIILILFALTDAVDGPIARELGKNSKFGALLDATADKFFVNPLIWIWGREFARDELFIVLLLVDFFGNPALALLNKFILKKKNIFEHSWVGKWKLAFQVVLVIILWYAKYYSPNWERWPILIYCFTSAVIGFAIASVISKIRND